MKDYSVGLEEQKKFILGFREKKDNIIVKFANSVKNIIPNNKSNKQKLLDKMKKQVDNSGNFEVDKKIQRKEYIKCAKFLVIPTIAFLILGIALFASVSTSVGFISLMCAALSGSALTGMIINILHINSLLADLDRNRNFIKIEDTLNNTVRKNVNILSNTSSKTKKMVASTSDDEPIFDINSFNNVPYRDLTQIMENIERDEFFGFDYETSQEVDKPKTKKKVR